MLSAFALARESAPARYRRALRRSRVTDEGVVATTAERESPASPAASRADGIALDAAAPRSLRLTYRLPLQGRPGIGTDIGFRKPASARIGAR
jgi:hypothetical protein